MQYLILLGVLGFLILTAVYAIFTDSTINSIISMSVFSINLTVVFIIMQAPDVAMTEAVIGLGLVTAFYVVAINKTEGM
ncbi:MAG: Na(+)/H(+) antiporter subunit B [bacterium]